MKTTHASVVLCHLNLRAVLASSTTLHIDYLNQRTNSAWTLLFQDVLLHGSLNRSTPISHLSGIPTVKSSLQMSLQCRLRQFKHSSTALLVLAFCHMLDGSRHMPPTPTAVLSTTSSLTLAKFARKLSNLKGIHYSYQKTLHQLFIIIEDNMLIFCEPIRGSTSYTCLQIVPKCLYDIVFIAFHSNPIGGHLNAYRTHHRLCIHYHWPEMYSFIKKMCNACPGCAPTNPTHSTSSELVYHFPIDAPFGCCLLTVTPPVNTSDSRAVRCTLLRHAV